MKPGATVAYVRDPSLYGVMVVDFVTHRGWVVCDDADGNRLGKFRPEELDDADKYFVPPVHAA